MYTKTTHGIKVTAAPEYLGKDSSPEDGKFLWLYTITIENFNTTQVQLVSRKWLITDEQGTSIVIEGDGVIGEKPVIKPGEGFKYFSGIPLSAPSGMMMGTYHLINEAGENFEADIPAFSLDSPYNKKMLN
ncbi:MAG: Co2+/Mg2+ efflux protein ApaG [Candidatus Paracaedibacteraceae bacterium]|nr:Co2+/Mg2+ efflux protein ApaG [Candidatus Paracaedibacteraceae bacterium]